MLKFTALSKLNFDSYGNSIREHKTRIIEEEGSKMCNREIEDLPLLATFLNYENYLLVIGVDDSDQVRALGTAYVDAVEGIRSCKIGYSIDAGYRFKDTRDLSQSYNARSLFTFLRNWAKEKNCKFLRACVRSDNTASLRLLGPNVVRSIAGCETRADCDSWDERFQIYSVAIDEC